MSNKAEQELAGVFAALGDATRLALVTRLLAAGALSATALAEGQAISRQAIVKHLQVLEAARLVVHERHGREVLYSLDAQQVDAARAFLDAISAGWDRALARLRTLVESD
ncbi:metalloregulator ArsR/SmtB family transcription factor [Rhizobium sp. YJ-22]|uniref:ArsR/SmtB family transcription factor n=1 Tax=Rhizobium sp. YJ-22 TaxID=3037556 RepID=UPI002412C5B0|nr:metalloregulator ArsR/SmtB family transcription factor [Rhizobium sp. YJ-22]MDG3579505.1 metalloregulator ArsR/SmtB family transcription factor [Rhizobium sp. YJ-22]